MILCENLSLGECICPVVGYRGWPGELVVGLDTPLRVGAACACASGGLKDRLDIDGTRVGRVWGGREGDVGTERG